MSGARDLLRRLDELGIGLSLAGNRIRYRSTDGRLTPELLAEMKERRDDLVGLLDRRAALRWPPHRDAAPGGERRGPLTRAQRTFWATDHFVDDGTYNLAGALLLHGPLDEATFTAAVSDVYRRHPALRTVFPAEHGEPVQRVLPVGLAPTVERVDRTGQSLDACVAECAELADRKLPLAEAPPVRMRLIRLAPGEHLFFVVLHHIVADAVAIGLLLADLAAGYRGSRLDTSDIDLIDVAGWERDRLAYADLAAGRRYWRDRLSGAELGALPLPPPLGPVTDRRGAASRLDLDPATAAAIRDLVAQRRASIFLVVAAAAAAALSRRTGRDDLVVGMPAGRRDRPGLERLVGPLLDMVPVRLDLAGVPTFADLVGRTRTAVLGALAHAEALADLPAAGRDLFNVTLTDAGSTLPVPSFPGLAAEHVEVPRVGTKYDLNILVCDGATITLEAEFDRAAIAETDVAALLGTAAEILAAGAADPSRRVADLATAAFGDPGRGAIGAEPAWTVTPDDSLTGRLARLGATQGDRVAVSDGDNHLTYRELAERVDLVGRALRLRGAGPGRVVAVSLPRGLDLVTAILGVLASGAACAVLDDSWPPTRRERVLADAAARQVISEADGTTVADLTRLGRGAPPCPPVRAGDTAYVIYTSGSTGRPKGVHVTHRNMLSLLAATGDGFGVGPDDVWTLFHSCSFDVAMYEMFGCLLHGGRLVVVPKWLTRDPEAFAALLGREQVTVLSLTPSAMSVLLPEAARDPKALDTVRYVLLAGEKLENRLAARWHREVGRGELVNLYGITETTVHASWLRLRPGAPTTTESDVGVPLPGTSLYLLHDDGAAVADGCVGEIYVGGPQVSLGYVGRPRETATRFVPDPFSRQPGARMYRSGDLGRRTGDRLAYLHRRDAQVQVNGFRVELPEIESVLAALPGVAAAAAAVATDDIGHRVVAAVVAEPGVALSTVDVLRGAGAELPNYMLPRSIAIVPALPLTVNGKLDRAAVLQAAGTAPAAPRQPAGAAAGSPGAAVLVELFRRVLDDPALGADADFFEAGGDSMRAIRLVALARDHGLHFSAREVYAAPRPAALAALADSAPRAGVPGTTLPFALLPGAGPDDFPAGVVDAYPMTALQTGMLYHQELAPDARVYHIVLSYRVDGRLDPAAFRAAAQAVVDAHPVLRTSLDLASPWGPVQRVHAGLETLPLRIEDLRGLDGTARDERIARAVADETSADFPLDRPGLFRLVALVTSDDDYQLVFSHNHVILDGWSVNVFFADLSAQYADRLAGAPPAPVPVPRTAFADYVALELAAADDPTHRQFWRTQTSADAPLVAPGRVGPPTMRQLRRELPGRLDGLRTLAGRVGVPVKALLCAVHLRVLAWLTGADDVVTSMVTNCRPEGPDADRILGLFLNQLPLRASLGGQSWVELARSLHERERRMLAHRWYPGALVQRDFGPRPMFDSGFNFTDYHTTQRLVRDGSVRFSGSEELEQTHYALSSAYTVDVRTAELRLLLEYDSAALGGPVAELAARAHEMALTALLADADASCLAGRLPGVLDLARATASAPVPPVAAGPAAPVDPAAPIATTAEVDPAGGAADPAVEKLVRQAWAEALGTEASGANDNFFEVGGDSLAAMRMVARLRASHPGLGMGAFLAEPTVAALVSLLAAGTPAAAAQTPAADRPEPAPEGPASVVDRPRRFPLSPAQLQMWSITNRLPGLPLFAIPGALRADGPLDPALLERSLALLAGRHDALRTRMEATDSGPVQVVEPAADLPLEYVDLVGGDDPVAEAERRMAAAVRDPIAVDRAPMLRAIAYRVAADRHLLYLTIHHMVCDGWSLSLLLADAARIYRALEAGGDVPPVPPGPGAAELVAAADAWRGSAEAKRQRAYWTERLAPPWPALAAGPGSRFPAGRPVSPIERLRSRTCRCTLDAATTSALRAAARRRGITDFMAVTTAYAMTLHSWSGQSDMRIGTILANRARPGVEEVVGLVANSAVLRVAAADAGRDELAARVRAACEGAYANQELAFEDVLEALNDGYPAELRDPPLFEVMLVMQEEIRVTDPAEGLRFAPYRAKTDVLGAPVAVTTCEFLLNVVPWDGELLLSLQYRPAVTDRATAVALLDDVAAALTALAVG
ncbi:non-ribosomal peptide synthetase [Rhizomonospora bruguierae]|uniref:non-ribosomal peptide synthetase n=1 Tax=Rhizomonospora bruguierae TaxID=1581705 RepID=UPI001BCE808B|nr:non-ribosomal peptide synthetase [Micromonospora sp. NBRC 107566]